MSPAGGCGAAVQIHHLAGQSCRFGRGVRGRASQGGRAAFQPSPVPAGGKPGRVRLRVQAPVQEIDLRDHQDDGQARGKLRRVCRRSVSRTRETLLAPRLETGGSPLAEDGRLEVAVPGVGQEPVVAREDDQDIRLEGGSRRRSKPSVASR